MSVERLKMPVAGPHNAPIPAPEYDYSAGVILAVSGAGEVSSNPIPAGTYRISVDADIYFKCASSPSVDSGTKDTAGVDFAPSGSCWHETFDGNKKIAGFAKSSSGFIRLIPIMKVAE